MKKVFVALVALVAFAGFASAAKQAAKSIRGVLTGNINVGSVIRLMDSVKMDTSTEEAYHAFHDVNAKTIRKSGEAFSITLYEEADMDAVAARLKATGYVKNLEGGRAARGRFNKEKSY